MVNLKVRAAGLFALALCLTAARGGLSMTQKEFIDLCRTGSAADVAQALSDEKLSAVAHVGGVTPLMAAASARGDAASAEKVGNLLAAGAQPNAADAAGRTPLMYAAHYSDKPEVIRVLLAAGAQREQKDRRGWNAVSYAAAKNFNVGVLNELIDAGANVNAVDRDGASPLLLAFRGGNGKDVVMALLAAGANPAQSDHSRNSVESMFRRSPLKKDAEIAAALKESPAVKAVSPERFVQVCANGAPNRVESLLKAGNDALAPVDGFVPLLWAVKGRADAGVLKALLAAGADANAADADGRTALMYAVTKNAGAVQVLMNAGARADLLDKAGKSALDYADEAGVVKETDTPALKAAAESLRAAESDRENTVVAVKNDYEKKLNDEFEVRAEKEKALAERDASLADLNKQLEAEKTARAEEAGAAAKAAEDAKTAAAESEAKIADLTKQLEAEKTARAEEAGAAAKAAEDAKTAAAESEAKVADLTKQLEAEKTARAEEAEAAAKVAKDAKAAAAESEAKIADLTKQLEAEKTARAEEARAAAKAAEDAKTAAAESEAKIADLTKQLEAEKAARAADAKASGN